MSYSIGLRDDASPGLLRLGVPIADIPYVGGGVTAGYGFFESLGPVSGTHHRLANQLAIGASVPKWLTYMLKFQSRLDFHPSDSEGEDRSFALDPRLMVRGGIPLPAGFQLGLEVDLLIPGNKGRSFVWDAFTLTGRLLGSFQKKTSPLILSANAGFRFDQSANALPSDKSLRVGDWISSGMSDFDAVVFGIGGGYMFENFTVLAEFNGDVLVGDGAPPASQSALCFGLGGRYEMTSQIQISLSTEVLVTPRPKVNIEDYLLPIEPRLSVTLGAVFKFGLGTRSPEEEEPQTKKNDSEDVSDVSIEAPATVVPMTISGQLRNETGDPIPDAAVTLTSGSAVLTTYTDRNGNFTIEAVPTGVAEVTVLADGFETASFKVSVTKDSPLFEPFQLKAVQVDSQVRGQVLSFEGNPIRAKVRLKPVGTVTRTNEEGLFSLDAEPGNYELVISAKGFQTQTLKVQVEEESVTIVNVELRETRRSQN